jgi:predicted dehydrogenase
MALDTVKIGIIGFGNMGTSHAGYLHRGDIPGATLTAICDTIPERLALAKERFGDTVTLFDDVEKLFASKAVDAVIIATPHYFHPRM